MEKLKLKSFLIIITGVIFLGGCSKTDLNEVNHTSFNVVPETFSYNLDNFEIQDQIKIVVGEALNSVFLDDTSLNSKIIEQLVDENQETKEFLFIKNKDMTFENGKTFEEILLDKFKNDSRRYNLIKQIETIIPNLVIKIPDWVNPVIKKMGLTNLEFAIYPGINSKNQFYLYQKKVNKISNKSETDNIISDYIPIQVKESEKLIPLKLGSDTTIWGDNLLDDHFPPLNNCTDFDRNDYIIYSNSEYQFLDKISLNEDLLNAELCGITITNPTSPQSCTQVFQRDCVTEKNVIEGFKMTNNAVFTGINNQPGGEDVISLHYVFVASQMCGDTTVPLNCPPTTWKFVFFGTINDFYEIQSIYGYPQQSEMNDVIYIGPGYYVKSFPKYYDIPVDLSFEGIYSQAPYLINTQNSTWDGNIYGSVVSFSIYEHDDVIVTATQSQTITVTNTTKVSTKLNIPGGIFSAGADFSSTVTRTATHTYNIEASKDVELGQNASVYFDQNYQTSALYGINKTTGSVTTHFAFYH